MIICSDPISFVPSSRTSVTESVNVEGKALNSLLKVTGVFQRYDVVNSNGRKYGKDLFENVLNESSTQEAFKRKSMLGLLEHPADGLTKLDRSPSHVILNAWDNGDGKILGEALILNTTSGKELAAIFSAGCSVGISSRGDGELINENGVYVVDPKTYKLITWDFVYDNSVPGARISMSPSESNDQSKIERVVIESADKNSEKEEKEPKQSEEKESLEDDSKNKKEDKKEKCDESSEYLTNNKSYSSSNMKLTEMRRLSLELTKAIPSSGCKSLGFNERVALSEQLTDIRSKVNQIVSEDSSLSGMGQKLLKRISEAEEEIEDIEVDPVEGEEEETSEETPEETEETTECEVDFDTFKNLVCKVLEVVCPDCSCGDIDDDKFKEIYTSFCKDGDLSELVTLTVGSDDSDEGDDDSSKYESAKRIIRALRLENRNLKGKNIKYKRLIGESKDLLRQTRCKLVKLDKANSLLSEAKTELERNEQKVRFLRNRNSSLKDKVMEGKSILRKVRSNMLNESGSSLKKSSVKPLTESVDDNTEELHDTVRIIRRNRLNHQ